MDLESIKQALIHMMGDSPAAEVRPKPYMEATPEEALFLKRMSAIESSSGQDVRHPEIKSGIHKDSRAIGQYGLMPNTIQETLKRAELEGNVGPNLEKLKALSPDKYQEAVANNPDLENELALRVRRRIMSRPGITNDDQANYMWQYGHNLDDARLKARDYLNSDRAIKFNRIKNEIK